MGTVKIRGIFWGKIPNNIKIQGGGRGKNIMDFPHTSRERLIPGTTAKGLMTDVGTDLFQIGHNRSLVMVDRYSNFPFVQKLTKLHTSCVQVALPKFFLTGSIPLAGQNA